MKKILLSLIILFLLVIASWLSWFVYRENHVALMVTTFTQCSENGYLVELTNPAVCMTPDGRRFVAESADVSKRAPDLIHITNPTSGQLVTSPITIDGEARGFWFFEGVFPIKLLDERGKEIGATTTHAIGEWTTENFVPFHAAITYKHTNSKTGMLVFMKDNPSGLAQNDQKVEIPVVFSTSTVAQ